MLRKTELLTKIADRIQTTYYLFDKEKKTLLPIVSPDKKDPSAHNTILKILKAFNSEILSIRISHIRKETYHVYVNVEFNGKLIEINADVSDALTLAQLKKVPIFLDESLLKKCGIKITRKLLEETLFI